MVDQSQICISIGAVAGQRFVDGDTYINSAFGYYASNRWRDVEIICAFMVGFMCTYLIAAECVSAKKSKGEVLVF